MTTSPLDILAKDAYAALLADEDAVLIDVRTPTEWQEIGRPSLEKAGKEVVFLSWRTLPNREVNPHFLEEIQAYVPSRKTACYLLCKGGGRSQEAALALAHLGYERCFNVMDGFEGRAGLLQTQYPGWKKEGLPWL